MNITADPGLPYTISHTYFTSCSSSKKIDYNKSILNITKQNPSIWSSIPFKINLKRKDDTFIIICPKTL